MEDEKSSRYTGYNRYEMSHGRERARGRERRVVSVQHHSSTTRTSADLPTAYSRDSTYIQSPYSISRDNSAGVMLSSPRERSHWDEKHSWLPCPRVTRQPTLPRSKGILAARSSVVLSRPCSFFFFCFSGHESELNMTNLLRYCISYPGKSPAHDYATPTISDRIIPFARWCIFMFSVKLSREYS